MAKFLDDLYVTGNNANVLVINSDAVADILLVSNAGAVAVGSDNFIGNVYTNPKFIINTGSGIPGLMHLNSFGVELVTFTNVSDSLFGNASNHDLSFITNDVERIKITAAGAVGINHLTPPAQLTIVGAGNTSSTHALRIGNSSSDILVNVQDNGYVGIGTITPSAKLGIFNSGPATDLLIQSIATIPFVIGNFNAFSVSNAGRIVSGYLDSNLASTVGHSFYAPQGATNILTLKTQGGTQSIFEVNANGSFQIGHLASTVTAFAHNGTNTFSFTGDIVQSVGINKSTPTAALDVLAGASGNIFKLNSANTQAAFYDALIVSNDGSFQSGSGTVGAGLGTFKTDHLTYTLNTAYQTYLAFSNAQGAGNKGGYGIIGASIGNADSDYRLVVLNNDTGTLGSVLKVVSTANNTTANDGFDYNHYAINIISNGAFSNAGAGTFYKIGLNLNVSGGDVNYAALFNGGNVGIGTTAPSANLEISTGAAYVFNGTTPVFKATTNSGGAYINVLNGGGIELNNFINNLGGDNSNQDFKSFFRHYEIMSPRNAVNTGGLTYFHITNNLSWNSAPYIRAGLNTLNTDQMTVFKIGLNRFGATQAASPTIVELEDSFGSLSMNGTTDYFKTGLKIILNDVYENTGTGNATSRGLYIDITNGDTNYAIETVGGSVVIGELAGVGARVVTVDANGVLVAGIGSGSLVSGSGTQNVHSKWDATGTALVDSLISDDATNITVSTFAGTGDRMVESASTGVITATRTIINTYGIPNTEKLKLEDPLNWDVNGNYTGASTSPATDIINTFQGQKHYNDNYFYEAVADNFFIRLIRG